MNALQNAVKDVKFRVPRPILEAVFLNQQQQWRQDPQTVDQRIMDLVIKPRVLVDCNLVGGAVVFVPLAGLTMNRVNQYTTVYRIPKHLTQGRSILSVLNITFADPTASANYGIAGGCQSSQLLQAGQQMMEAMSQVPITSTAQVQLIGENTVMVRDTVLMPPNTYLRCLVANDENMNHLQVRNYRHFSKLVEYAVKAYIYNEYIIPMDVGQLYGGHMLGRFKDVIDGYADCEELYQTYLAEKFQKVSMMNDLEAMNRHIQTLVGGRR